MAYGGAELPLFDTSGLKFIPPIGSIKIILFLVDIYFYSYRSILKIFGSPIFEYNALGPNLAINLCLKIEISPF